MEYQWKKGVCINPKKMTYNCSKKYTVIIELAQAPNTLWTYGLHFYGNMQFFGFTCSHTLGRYSSEHEAMQKAIAEAIYRIQHRSEPETYNRLIKILQQELFSSQQLSLFV